MSNPYSGGGSSGPDGATGGGSYNSSNNNSSSSNNSNINNNNNNENNTSGPRQPSYATVAAGSAFAASVSASRFNTLGALGTGGASSGRQQQHVSRQPSRSSLRSIEVDAGAGWKRPGGSPAWAAEMARGGGGAGGGGGGGGGRVQCPQHEEHPPFFTPSYLRHSRHVERLRRAWERHMAEVQERALLNPAPPAGTGAASSSSSTANSSAKQPSLSASSSSANLNKTYAAVPHVHRGVAQDVIERLPPQVDTADEKSQHPLPSKWSEEDKMGGLEVINDGSEVRFTGVTKTLDEAASIRSDHPMPRECGLYYFEVTVLSRAKDGLIGVGFSGPKVNLHRLPGWEAESWAYHGDDGHSYACTATGKEYGPKFSAQDVIGCGVNFKSCTAFFTKNGVYLGVAFTGLKAERLYPSVGMKRPNEHLRVNFGRTPFVFDIDRMMEQEREGVMETIGKTDVSSLHPPDDEATLIHNLIGQYLAHEGYVETAKAFAKDVQEQRASLPGEESKSLQLPDAEDDVHAYNRQKIRKSILDGDMDRALKYAEMFYPHVLKEDRNKDVYFRLRCRKFIEMMKRHTELQAAAAAGRSADSRRGGTLVGGSTRAFGNDEPGADTQMELDDQLYREASTARDEAPSDDVDMDTSQELTPPVSPMKQNDLLTAILEYGRELRAEFAGDSRPRVQRQLQDVFATMAYTDPVSSVVGPQMDPKGRVQIAEEVNGAILVSLGKPPHAALEKLCAQTEMLLDETAGTMGASAAFINVRNDFLRG